jgi:hypothetical protein
MGASHFATNIVPPPRCGLVGIRSKLSTSFQLQNPFGCFCGAPDFGFLREFFSHFTVIIATIGPDER